MLLRYLQFELSEGDEGVCTLEAMASVRPAASAAVRAEVDQVLRWIEAQFPGAVGPVEEGFAWHHALLVQHEAGDWVTITLTVVATPEVAAALLSQMGGDAR